MGNSIIFCDRFTATQGDKHIALYRQKDVQTFINLLSDSDDHGYYSVKSHYKAVASVFNLIVDLGRLDKSPAKHVTFQSARGLKRKELFEADDVQALLDHIWAKNKAWAGVYALLFFTGLRVSMMASSPTKRARGEFIALEMINVKEREIIIPEGIMKAENSLNIDADLAPSNLWPWLTHISEAKFPEPSQTFNKRRSVLCKAAGVKWSDNVHRRSCASYYAAIHGRSKASDLLGNTEEMIVKHYLVPTFRKKAEAYFRVLPPNR